MSRYATRVASMVNTSVYYKEHTIPGSPTEETFDAEDDDSDNIIDDFVSVDKREDDGFHARDYFPSTSIEGSDKVCTS